MAGVWLLLPGLTFGLDLPRATWRGGSETEVEGLQGRQRAVVASPLKLAAALAIPLPNDTPAGEYELRLTLRPSHVAEAIAFMTTLQVAAGPDNTFSFCGADFGRVHQPETRRVRFVHKGGPLTIKLSAATDAKVVEKTQTAAKLKQGGPQLGDGLGAEPGGEASFDLGGRLAPASAVYFVVDAAELVPIARSGRVAKVDVDRVRYAPGATLKARVTVEDVGARGGNGTLRLFLEHGLKDRVEVFRQPVELKPQAQTIAAEIRLPEEELGYALVGEYRSADGADVSEAAQYFSIAANFQRVAVFGVGGGHGSTKLSEERMRANYEAAKAGYGNCFEAFAWGEDDMVELTPETDFWFSGQTAYHMSKKGLQRAIAIAHEYGISAITYGKMIMGGYIGWKTAYDYPNDHRGQYFYPVGMWEGVNVPGLDFYRNKEFAIYESTPKPGKRPFDVFTAPWCPINPDSTPRMVRIAAEEMAASSKMFGWDAVRWDGHPRGGGQCGGDDGGYDAAAARRTQALVRYFKDIVAAQVPGFQHGYNYLLIQKNPSREWAVEDFELDELCRGGGLLMNESIGNATSGPYDYIARNLQVEGDLCRERGGYFLGISYAQGPRDGRVEEALWAAAGARAYGAFSLEFRRYVTRYSQYCLDERLRRLDAPEKVLAPAAPTRLWWQPFVYETPWTNGQRQLVVNLLNVPLGETRSPEGGPFKYKLLPGTEPVEFALTLPAGMKATAAHMIDTKSLDVTPLPLKDGRFPVPSVTIWQVAVIDLEVAEKGPSLGELYGPPKTVGAKRAQKESTVAMPEVVLNPSQAVWEVNKDLSVLSPGGTGRTIDEAANARAALPPAERNAAILKIRAENPMDGNNCLKGWWKGGSLPADLSLQDKPRAFGDLSPRRDGCFDIYHARGAMDYKLRLPETFIRLPRFQVYDAPLVGLFRAGGGHALQNGLPWKRFPEFDLLLYTAIPHCAIGAENAYAMVDYVKAGGAVLFTGGEYAFGKGGYQYTVLERELLPVLCAVTVDTRYADPPLPMEPGPDFAELGLPLDFKDKPSFWVWNEVALKDEPGIKVFLKSGNIPILVGRQVGKGRVACLLVDHRGKSEDGRTAFFEWAAWPRLTEAVVRWLAPNALDKPSVARGARPGQETALPTLRRLAEQEEADAILKSPPAEAGAPGAGADAPMPEPASLAAAGGVVDTNAVAVLTDVLTLPASDALDRLLLHFCLGRRQFPDDLRWRLLDRMRGLPVDVLRSAGREALASKDMAAQGMALQALALAGAPEFAAELSRTVDGLEETLLSRERALALGVALYKGPDLATEGKRRLAAWDADEAALKQRYTGGKEFSLEAPEVPLLDSETLFQRVAWLDYLARQDPVAYGARFVRQWMMLAHYRVYCDRTIGNLWDNKQIAPGVRRTQVASFARLRACIERLQDQTKPDLLALAESKPDMVAAGFRKAHFTAEYRAALNIIGLLSAPAAATVWDGLQGAYNMDLAELAAARKAAQ